MPDGTISYQIMRSLFEKKHWVLLISILALGALTVLSFSLKNVSFREAQPVSWVEAESSRFSPQVVLESSEEVSVQSQIILLVLLIVLTILVGILLSPEARRRMIRIIIRMAATCLGLYYLFKRYPEILSAFNLGGWGDSSTQQADASTAAPSPVFVPPQEIPWLSYLTSLMIVLGIIYLIWKLYRAWMVLIPQARKSPLQEVARVARSSLRELSSGHDAGDVITNCYFRMSDVVADKHNLRRGIAMTTTEFAGRLEQSGLPRDAVRSLTRLFEMVRYGSHKAGPRETSEAVACLTAILSYCGESV